MTTEDDTQIVTPNPKSYRQRARETVQSLAWQFKKGQWSRGEIACLKKLEVRRPDQPRVTQINAGDSVFEKLFVTQLEANELLSDQSSDLQVSQWVAIIQGLATVYSLQNSRARLGTAIHRTGIDNRRLLRFAEASGYSLWLQTRRIAQYIYNKGQFVDWADAADLVLSEGRPHAADVRRQLMRDYKRERFSLNREQESTSNDTSSASDDS